MSPFIWVKVSHLIKFRLRRSHDPRLDVEVRIVWNNLTARWGTLGKRPTVFAKPTMTCCYSANSPTHGSSRIDDVLVYLSDEAATRDT
jgi:hypothetical protein